VAERVGEAGMSRLVGDEVMVMSKDEAPAIEAKMVVEVVYDTAIKRTSWSRDNRQLPS